MEYPGTKLTKPFRISLLLFFIFLFCLLAPAIIMYTAGYRYDWHNGLLKETGAISIDIEPADAGLYLNGIKIKEEMPVRLNNIAPGKYNLRISADGYYDWTKDLEVKNKQTTYIKEISLLQKNRPEIIIQKKADIFALSEDGKYIIYTISAAAGGSEIWLYTTADKQSVFIAKTAAASPQIIWSKKANYAAVADGRAPYAHLLVINADDPYNEIDLPATVRNIPAKFQWSSQSGSLLYYSARNGLRTFDAATSQDRLVARNSYQDWILDDRDRLWTIGANTTTGALTLTGDALGSPTAIPLSDEQAVDANIVPDGTQWSLLAAQKNTVLLKNEQQPEMTLIANGKKFNVAGDKFKISRYNDWWLIWTRWEIWTFTEGEEPYLLNRSGENLQEVFPLDQYNTLALVWADKTTALFPYYLVSHDLLNEKITHAEADSAQKIIYFSARNGDREGIWQLKY